MHLPIVCRQTDQFESLSRRLCLSSLRCTLSGHLQWFDNMTQFEEDFRILQGHHEGDMVITSQSDDSNVWLVRYKSDNGPDTFFTYNRATRTPTLLFDSRQDLAPYPLSLLMSVVVTARDGFSIPCYVALPPAEVGPPTLRLKYPEWRGR